MNNSDAEEDLLHTYTARTPTIRRGRRSTKRLSADERTRVQEENDVKRTTSFTDEELDEFHQIFDFYDVDNTKTIDLGDLEKAMKALGLKKKSEEMKELVLLLDVDGDTTVDFSEFCMIIDHIKSENEEFEELREAFKCLDHNEDGSVLNEDLIEMMMTKADGMSLKDVTEMIRFSDAEKTGRTEYKEFVESLKIYQSEVNMRDYSNLTLTSDASQQEGNPVEEIKSWKDKNKKSKKRKSHCCQPRHVETVDTVLKAIGGPVLLTSAVIIHYM